MDIKSTASRGDATALRTGTATRRGQTVRKLRKPAADASPTEAAPVAPAEVGAAPVEVGAAPVEVAAAPVEVAAAPAEVAAAPAEAIPPPPGSGEIGTGGGGSESSRAKWMWAQRRWIVVAVIVALLSPWAWSYGRALAAPGNTPFTVRSVEWVRDNHGRWLVNDIENWWYNHHKPKKGGAPKNGFFLPSAAAPARPPTTTATVASPAATAPLRAPGPATKHLPPPPPIPPMVAGPLPGEGVWHPLGQPVAGVPAMYAAYLRPDPVYTSLVTGVAWMDPTLVKAVLYAGVQEPGGGGWRYQAPIAPADRTGLLAAFNSGFKLKDSQGGYYAEGRMVTPLRAGAATLAIRSDGTPTVGQWGRDIQMGPDIAYARQNLALIVDNGRPVPDISQTDNAKWGATLGNKVLVWRSGVGVTANGALVYAGGNNLSAATLAGVLAQAGAVRAMELDINSAWVDFFSYTPATPGQPPGDLNATKLLPDMRSSPTRYFTANSRDFFAIFSR